jgi:hypothetical protein
MWTSYPSGVTIYIQLGATKGHTSSYFPTFHIKLGKSTLLAATAAHNSLKQLDATLLAYAKPVFSHSLVLLYLQLPQDLYSHTAWCYSTSLPTHNTHTA